MQLRVLFVLTLGLMGLLGQAFGQAVTTSPVFPNFDASLTITVDIKEATDGRAQGLLNLDTKGEVFLWSGVGTAANAFQFVPPEQAAQSFNEPMAEKFELTPLGNSVWQITITDLRSFYDVPAGTTPTRFGLVLKNGAGNAQTENFTFDFFEDGLQVSLSVPTQNAVFVDFNETIAVTAVASSPVDFELFVAGNLQETAANLSNWTTEVVANRTAPTEVLVVGTDVQGQKDSASFVYVPRGVTPPEPLPSSNLELGVNYDPNDATKATLLLQAPNKNSVYVVGDFTDWRPSIQMVNNGSDIFWAEITGLTPGKEHVYYYLVDETIRVADPYGTKILDPVEDQFIPEDRYPNLIPYPAEAGTDNIDRATVLQTNATPYEWGDDEYTRPVVDDLIIYELLVRDFTDQQDYQRVIDSLDYLENLGINAIELMPIMEFNGNLSWGYNPTFMLAPDKFYGTANKLKELIDKAHQRGMAVILDMVLNQQDFPSPLVKMYWTGSQPTADNPWFHQSGQHPANVFYDMDHTKELTQQFMDRVNRYWIEEFHFDGFRFDLSKGFTVQDYCTTANCDSGSEFGTWSNYSQGRVDLLKRMADEIWKVDPDTYVILEHFADNDEEKELAEYGMMLWGNMHFNYKDAVLGFVNGSDFTGISYQARNWEVPHLVGYMESHDEERLMYDAQEFGNQQSGHNIQNVGTALERVKMAAAFLIPVPGPKMIWQFGEFGYDISLEFNGRTGEKPTRWEYLQDSARLQLFEVFANLNKLKTSHEVFRTTNFTLAANTSIKRLALEGQDMDVVIVGNFGMVRQFNVNVAFTQNGTWYDYFSGDTLAVNGNSASLELQPSQFHVFTSQRLESPENNPTPWELYEDRTQEPTGLEETAFSQEMVLYPNPGSGRFMLQWGRPTNAPTYVKVQNTQGQTVYSQQFDRLGLREAALNLDQLPTGLYLVEVKSGNRHGLKRLMVK